MIQQPNLQETTEAHLETARAKRLQETTEKRKICLEKPKAKGKQRINKEFVNQKDSLEMNNNGLLLALSIQQLNLQVR